MSSNKDYVFNRIKEAMTIHKGNTAKARQQIIAWTYEDAKLLHALSRPHLTGIVAYAVDRFQRNILETPSPSNKFESVLDRPSDDDFGKEMLRSMVTGRPEIFGEEPSGAGLGRSQASKRHQDIMKFLASQNRYSDRDNQ